MYEIKESKYTDLFELIDEAKKLNAFVQSKEDKMIFLDCMKELENISECYFFLYIKDNSVPIGFAIILPYKDNKILSIGPIYIKEKFQGQGLGKQLVEELIFWAKNNRKIGLFTKTWGENIRSRKIFVELGFSFLKEEKNVRMNGDSTIQYLIKWN